MITSVSNSRVKRVVALNTKARERRLEGRYVVEGIKLFQEAPEEEMDEIYISEHFLQMASASACAGNRNYWYHGRRERTCCYSTAYSRKE